MNAKQLADKYGMLSHDEIDLLQECVNMLQPTEMIVLNNVTEDEWKEALNEHRQALVANVDPIIIANVQKSAFLQPITVVNIGASIGTSSCAILEANPNAFIFSIDVKPWPEERQHIIECGLNPKRIVRLLGSSSEIGKHFPYEADLVFVDGAHDDKGVIGDIEVWKPKCRSIMLFHDYHHPNYAKKPGVNLDNIVDAAMADWERIGEARYLVAFRRKE